MIYLAIFLSLFAISDQYQLGRLYHFSYTSKVEALSYVRQFLPTVKITDRVDVCSLWEKGSEKLLKIQLASDNSANFAVAYLVDNTVVNSHMVANSNSEKVKSLLSGFIQLLNPQSKNSSSIKRGVITNMLYHSSIFRENVATMINATQQIIFPVDASTTNIAIASLFTSVHLELSSTSDCLELKIEASSVVDALSTIAHQGLDPLAPRQKRSQSLIHNSDQCAHENILAQIDCVSASNSAELHRKLFSDNLHRSFYYRRYFANVCLRRQTDPEVVLKILETASEAYSNSKDDAAKKEITYGISCLVNQACPSFLCEKASDITEKHLNSALHDCKSDISCQVSLVRALQSAIANVRALEVFIFELATKANQHPQITAGSLRALIRPVSTWAPNNDQYMMLLELFEKSPSLEVRFAALDLLLSLEPKPDFADALMREFIVAQGKTEFGAYLATKLQQIISTSDLFRKVILGRNGRILFFLNNNAKQHSTMTSAYVEGELFDGIPLNFVLDVQNMAPDTLVHSSFSIQNGQLRLFDFEIDAVAMDALMGSFLGGGGESQTSADPAASITLKFGSAPGRGIVIARHADLFRGQDDVMSAVWNAPSDPVDAAKINSTIVALNSELTLLNGLVAETSVLLRAAAAIKGSASISLWSQTAETVIATNVVINTLTTVKFPALEIQSYAETQLETDLSFKTNIALGSSGRPDVCLRMTRDKAQIKFGFSEGEINVASFAPVTYAFHSQNSQSCKKQLSGDSW